MAILVLAARSPSQASDQDLRPGHLPAKIWTDLPGFVRPSSLWILGTGGALAAWDWGTKDKNNPLPQHLSKPSLIDLYEAGRFYGNGLVPGVGALSCWALGAWKNKPALAAFGRDSSEAFLLFGSLGGLLKVSVQRPRPSGDHYSFPSGHTGAAFCLVPVLGHYGGWLPAALGTGAGIVTALSRVRDRRHYLSDTLAGAVLGLAAGNAAVHGAKRTTVSLDPSRKALVITMSWR